MPAKTLPRTVPVKAAVTMSATGALTHLCPFRDEVDRGAITLKWETNGCTLELHSLRTYLAEFADTTVSHEDLTASIKRDLQNLPGIAQVEVTTVWDTANMTVQCSI